MNAEIRSAPIVAQPQPGAMPVMLNVAAQREIAEVQAAILMARQFPRDMILARDRVTMACARPELAEVALYTYARGGTDITGPSIRLAECLAQLWGNLQFGIRELEQRATESTVEAFAIDLETNVRQVKIFQVPHVRYTKAGGRQSLADPRDIYENVANQGARRLRACILGIIPGDVIDAAVHQVELTLKTKDEVTPERIEKLLGKFAAFEVTREQIEKRIQRRLDAITPALMLQLGKIHNSLRDGMSRPGDWFETVEGEEGDAGKSGAEGVKAALRKRAKAAAPSAPADVVQDRKKEDAPPQPDLLSPSPPDEGA